MVRGPVCCAAQLLDFWGDTGSEAMVVLWMRIARCPRGNDAPVGGDVLPSPDEFRRGCGGYAKEVTR